MGNLFQSLLSLLALGNVMIEDPVSPSVISRALRTLALVVINSLLIVAVLLTGFVCLYHYLITMGFSELRASLLVLCGLTLIAIISTLLTLRHSRCLTKSLRSILRRPVSLTAHIANEATSVVTSFVDGLLKRK